MRLKRGVYGLIDPSVSVRAWALDDYYADLLVLHDVLESEEITHAFVCLSSSLRTDYDPRQVWPVLSGAEERLDAIDAFRLPALEDHELLGGETISVEAMGLGREIPITGPDMTALLLAASGLARPRRAAEQLIEGRTPEDSMTRWMNHYALEAREDVYESEDPEITVPEKIVEQRTEEPWQR